jgi:aprataxin and PNK-like factor
MEVLRKDSEVVLGNLDVFSLLPDEFEFTVKVSEENEIASSFRVREIDEINENLETGDMAVSLSQFEEAVSSTSTELPSRKRSLSQEDESIDTKKMKPSSPTTSTQPSSSQPASSTTSAQPSSTSEVPVNPPDSAAALTPSIKPDPDSTEQTSADPNLPSTSTNGVVKPDPDAVKTEAVDNNSTTCQSNSVPPPAPASAQPVRPSCEFGIRCYRLTDDHRRAYAHPMDNDYRRPPFPPADPGGE